MREDFQCSFRIFEGGFGILTLILTLLLHSLPGRIGVAANYFCVPYPIFCGQSLYTFWLLDLHPALPLRYLIRVVGPPKIAPLPLSIFVEKASHYLDQNHF